MNPLYDGDVGSRALNAHWAEREAREAWQAAGREYAARVADPNDLAPKSELRVRVGELEVAHVEAVRLRDATEAAARAALDDNTCTSCGHSLASAAGVFFAQGPGVPSTGNAGYLDSPGTRHYCTHPSEHQRVPMTEAALAVVATLNTEIAHHGRRMVARRLGVGLGELARMRRVETIGGAK